MAVGSFWKNEPTGEGYEAEPGTKRKKPRLACIWLFSPAFLTPDRWRARSFDFARDDRTEKTATARCETLLGVATKSTTRSRVVRLRSRLTKQSGHAEA